jgi:hypothetical protein
VTVARSGAGGLLLVALAAGTVADRPQVNPPLTLGGYRVIAADFHTHSSTWSDGGLTPFGLVLEAQRQGLDAMAITGHNQVADSKVGRWFSRMIDGPTILVGQEILSPGRDLIPSHDLIAVGIEDVVDWHQDIAHQIDDVHRQGGIAIAAHPMPEFWPAYDSAAMERLDGSEMCHPLIYVRDNGQRELERFAARAPMAAIGSSDHHGFGRLGMCRTYVFARDDSAAAIVEALRAHRTVVYGLDGKAYGDPMLVPLADSVPRLRADALAWTGRGGWLDWASRIAGIAGLWMLIFGARVSGAASTSRRTRTDSGQSTAPSPAGSL